MENKDKDKDKNFMWIVIIACAIIVMSIFTMFKITIKYATHSISASEPCCCVCDSNMVNCKAVELDSLKSK